MAKRPTNNYVNNKQFHEAMVKYIKLCKEAEEAGEQRPKIPEYIGSCIYLIANRYSTKPNFARYSYRDEMISDGIEVCIRYLHNYNPEKSNNPLAYFTQFIHFAFLQRITKEKKQALAKAKMLKNSAIYSSMIDDPTNLQISTGIEIDDDKIAELERAVKPKNKRD